MENASKALIMAGSVLISLMIIGALLLMFNNLSNYQNTGTQSTREAQVIAFNNQYETYNRKNVRGSDLYSLLNRVVDYNRRKSTAGTGTNDEGQMLAYEPMTIKFNLGNTYQDDFWATNTNDYTHLIQTNDYTQSATTKDFENSIRASTNGHKGVDELKKTYGENVMNELAIAKNKIFIESTATNTKKSEAIDTFNRIIVENNLVKKIEKPSDNPIKNWDVLLSHKENVYRYYEYLQFKRAKFDCKDVTYNEQTGRITMMSFEFTGKFE